MHLPLNDPLLQTCFVGVFLNLVGAAMALYLWTERRADVYLALWSSAWFCNGTRWAIHYPATWNTSLRVVEGVLIAAVLALQVMGLYELLPRRPWNRKRVFGLVVLFEVLAGIYAAVEHAQVPVGYALLAANCFFGVWCMWRAYSSRPLPGYAIGIFAHAWQAIYVAWGLWVFGPAFTDHVSVPLVFNTLLMLSIVMIAYQLRRIELQESEDTLNQIFETAPTPILITRPPTGEIERVNRVAIDLLGLPAERPVGRTAVELGIVTDKAAREEIYRELEAGRQIKGRELSIDRLGERRIVAVNAGKVPLRDGPRFVFSMFDLTDLRRAEAELRNATEEMRGLYMRLGTVEDDERRALQRDLHDLMGANLVALRLEIDLIGALLNKDDRAGVASHLDSARQVAAEMIALARNLLAELRPPALDEYGLVAALRTYSETRGSRLNLTIRVDGDDIEPRLETFVEGALFRIVQEALTNAAKHAQAREVVVRIEQAPDEVRVTVSDDGIGFKPEAANGMTASWGLKNMRERALAIGARLSLQSAPNQGTCVVVSVARNGA
jgi:PAS domain S-box-containing protein